MQVENSDKKWTTKISETLLKANFRKPSIFSRISIWMQIWTHLSNAMIESIVLDLGLQSVYAFCIVDSEDNNIHLCKKTSCQSQIIRRRTQQMPNWNASQIWFWNSPSACKLVESCFDAAKHKWSMFNCRGRGFRIESNKRKNNVFLCFASFFFYCIECNSNNATEKSRLLLARRRQTEDDSKQMGKGNARLLRIL